MGRRHPRRRDLDRDHDVERLERKNLCRPFGPPPKTELWSNTNPDFGSINYAHQAYLDASRYYIDWFKTGRPPLIREDRVFYFYRPEPKSAVGKLSSAEAQRGLQKIDGAQQLQDKIFVSAFLSAPARLTILSGQTAQRFDLAAGVQHVSMAYALGAQRLRLERGGKVLWEKTTEHEVKERGGESKYNYFAGEATARP